uniref:Genome polyprotein n=1 Tax=Soybean thrips iflavirus 3 TaxID=2797874 RepID=A0A7T7WLU1_9VIRU|nr:polyprotein [Soybean thrips iflavirus 3]
MEKYMPFKFVYESKIDEMRARRALQRMSKGKRRLPIWLKVEPFDYKTIPGHERWKHALIRAYRGQALSFDEKYRRWIGVTLRPRVFGPMTYKRAQYEEKRAILLKVSTILHDQERTPYVRKPIAKEFPISNRFAVLEQPAEVWYDVEEAEELQEDTPYVASFNRYTPEARRVRSEAKAAKAILRQFVDKGCEWTRESFELVRNINLLQKLRRAISTAASHRVAYRSGEVYIETVEPQMENAHGGGSEQTVQASNVVLGETEQESVGIAAPTVPPKWYKFSSNEEFQDYKHETDRYTFLKTIEWKTEDQPTSYDLLEEWLPIYAVKTISKDNRGNVPFCVPFNIYRYWRGDIELKFQVNSNKFQTGQLQCAWLYNAYDYVSNYDNIYTASQNPHCLINAGASNEASLYIPYKHWRPLLHTKNRTDYVGALEMGKLTMRVVVPLRIAPNAKEPRSCSVSVFIRLVNSQFTGMVDGVLEPQMLSSVRAIAHTVDSVLGDLNCDNASDTQAPKYLVPTAAHSFSAGYDIAEPLHSLRLSGKPVGVGRTAEVGTTESRFSDIASIFGMLNHITWTFADSAKNKQGYLLWSTSVHPICDKKVIKCWPSPNQLDNYAIPPVGVISSLFQYWRGSLEFRFDIIASQFHTGRLLIAYVPDYNSDSITLEQARNSAHAVFSLQEQQSFTFTVPFICDKPWWRRRYAGPQRQRENAGPSRLFLFVLNPLVAMESVTPEVTIVPYIRAAADFEVAVPVQPSIGLRYNSNVRVPETRIATTKDGYAPVYCGKWHSFVSGKAIIRYGPGSDHVSQFDEPDLKTNNEYIVWELITDDTIYINGSAAKLKYVVFWHDSGYIYGIPFDETRLSACREVAKALKSGKGPGDVAGQLIDSDKETEYGKAKKLSFRPLFYRSGDKIKQANEIDLLYDSDAEYEKVEHQMDERKLATTSLAPVSLLPSSNAGVAFFGERYADFKDLSRRYQLMYTGQIKVDIRSLDESGSALFSFPAVPHGMKLDIDSRRPEWNVMRDGQIPIINSGYRFFRGGLRYKIVIANAPQLNVWIQHHPDKPFDGQAGVKILDMDNRADRYKNHGYAMYIQSLNINNIIEFEVPFYQSGTYGILSQLPNAEIKTDRMEYYSLGDIVVGLEGVRLLKTELSVSIYYSIADDFSYNCFAGFPPMLFCDEAYQDVEPQMMGFMSSLGTTVAGSILGKAISTPVSVMKNELKNEVTTSVKAAVMPYVADVKQQVQTTAADIMSDVSDWMKHSGMLVALSQLTHIVVNPEPMTIAVSLVSIVCMMCQVSVEIMAKLYDRLSGAITSLVKKCWTQFSGESSDLQEDPLKVEPQGFINNLAKDDISVISSCIFTAMSLSMGTAVVGPKNFPNLMRNINGSVSLLNNCITFIKNSGDTIVYCVKYILGYDDGDARIKALLEANVPEIADWVKEIHILLDPRNLNKILRDPSESNRVFDACMFGSILITNKLHEKSSNPRVVVDAYNSVCKLRDKILELGNHPDVRYECFPIWIAGPPGIGKTYLTTHTCKELLQHINYKSDECMIYWLSANTKYWNGIRNPPVIARDDAYCLDGLSMDEELANHFMICSSCILNPSMAAVEDKQKRLNPLIYFMNSNSTFPTIPPAKTPQAIYRRRKVLAEARYTQYILDKYGDNIQSADIIEPEDLENSKHLELRIARNPADINTQWSEWGTYDWFLNELKNRFKNHIDRENINFKKRVEDAYCLSERVISEPIKLPDALMGRGLKDKMDQAKRAAAQTQRMFVTTEEEETFSGICSAYAQSLNDYWSERIQHQNGESYPGCSSWTYEECKSNWLLYKKVLLKEEVTPDEVDSARESYKRYYFMSNFKDSASFVKFLQQFASFTGLSKNNLQTLFKDFDNTTGSLDELIEVFAPAGSYGGTIKIFDKVSFLNIEPNNASQPKVRAEIPDWSGFEDQDQLVAYLNVVINRYLINKCMNMPMTEPMEIHRDVISKFFPNESAEIIDVIVKRFFLTGNSTNIFWPNYLNKSEACSLAMFLNEHITNLEDVTYCASRDKFIYKDILGFTITCNARCNCDQQNCIMKNRFVLALFQALWDKQKPDQFYNACRYQQMDKDLSTWFENMKSKIECWWAHYIKPTLFTILRFILDTLPLIILLLAAFARIYGTYKQAKMLKEALSEGVENLESQKGNYFKFDSPKFKQNTANFGEKHFVPPQTTVQRNVLRNKIESNTVIIDCAYLYNGERMNCQARCIIIYGRTMLFLKHYYEEHKALLKYNPVFTMYFNVGGKQQHREMRFDELYSDYVVAAPIREGADSNYCLVTLPTYIPQFKSIESMICTIAQHQNLPRLCDLYVVGDQLYMDLELKKDGKFCVGPSENSSAVRIDSSYTYSKQGKGVCGSAVVCNTVNSGNGGIIGFHVAGSPSKNFGVAEPIYREMFQEYRGIGKKYPEVIRGVLEPIECANIELDTNLLAYGCVKEEWAHHESGKSKIVPSMIAGQVYEVLTEPNPLRPNDPRQPPGSHPLRDGCNKHGTGILRPFPKDVVDEVMEDQKKLLQQVVLPVRLDIKPLTQQQAICGDIDIPHFESLNWTSSEGFPLCNFRPKNAHNKKWLFDLDETEKGYELKGLHPQLEKLLLLRAKARASNIVPMTVYIDNLKDYRLSKDKCKIPGKTRIFSISPVQLTIDFKTYCSDFTASYKHNFIYAEHGIGINPDSLDWTKLVHYLCEVGTNIVTGDYSNFGPCLSSEIAYRSCENIVEWYRYNGASEEHIRVVEQLLYEEVINPLHLCNNVVYQTLNGIASGSAITSELNSEVNKSYLKIIYLLLARKHDPARASLKHFKENVRVVTYGDDFILCVSDAIKDWFNLVTIIEEFKKYNIIVTSSDKGAEPKPYDTLENSTFLKRSFKSHPTRSGVVLAPVDRKSVEECINWVHASNDDEAAVLEVCRASLELAYGHGPEYYEQHAERVCKALRSHNIVFRYESWNDRDREIFSDDCNLGINLKIRVPAYMN